MILILYLSNWSMMLIIIYMINMIILFDLTSLKFYTCLTLSSTLSQWDWQNSELICSLRLSLNKSMMLMTIFMQLCRKFAINEFSNTSNLLYLIKQLWWLFNRLQMSNLILHLISRFWCYLYMISLLWKTDNTALSLLVRRWFSSYSLSSLMLKSQISLQLQNLQKKSLNHLLNFTS